MRLLSGMNKLYTEWSINTRDLKLSTLLQNCKNRLPDFLKTPVQYLISDLFLVYRVTGKFLTRPGNKV